jgi:hypothetical protein
MNLANLFNPLKTLVEQGEAAAADRKTLIAQGVQAAADRKEAVRLLTLLTSDQKVEGIFVSHAPPSAHSASDTKENVTMASVKFLKKSQLATRGLKVKLAPVGGAVKAVSDFVIMDNEDDTCTVLGMDQGEQPLDISALATLSGLVSNDPTKVTADSVNGMTFAEHAVGPLGKGVGVSVTATWNDGSVGPFVFTDLVDVVNSPAGGIMINHGVPTVRPAPAPAPAP